LKLLFNQKHVKKYLFKIVVEIDVVNKMAKKKKKQELISYLNFDH
jgi:hypothetical protein